MDQQQVRYWQFCPQCRVSAGGQETCPRCGRDLAMTRAEEYAEAMVASQPKPNRAVSGCAGIVAAGILVVIGLVLLVAAPPVGGIYFVGIFIIALLRVLLRA